MAKQDNKRSIHVYAHWLGMVDPLLMGVLHSDRLKGKEIFSFEYDEDWLKSEYAQIQDQNIRLHLSTQLS